MKKVEQEEQCFRFLREAERWHAYQLASCSQEEGDHQVQSNQRVWYQDAQIPLDMEGLRTSSHLWAPGPNWKAPVSNASLVSTTETMRGRHSHCTDWQPQGNTTGLFLTCLASSFPLIPVREWTNKSGVRTQRCFSLTRPDSSLGISEVHFKKPTLKGDDCFHLRQLVMIPLGSI